MREEETVTSLVNFRPVNGALQKGSVESMPQSDCCAMTRDGVGGHPVAGGTTKWGKVKKVQCEF